jgi:sugar/nucleoside kinase (ribokinase family)
MLFDSKRQVFHKVPALSTRVVDRIGAGDAFLSLASIALAKGLSPEIAAFLGSVAAALDVQIVCNREPINPVLMKKYIATLLK